MIQSLTASGFRCFREIRVEPLTRVNLFVGENNAGKTSLLEAVELLAVGGVEGLARSPLRRGELITARPDPELKEHIIDPAHLFFGHKLRSGSFFEIRGQGELDRWVKCRVQQVSDRDAFILSLSFESHVTAQQETGQRLTISPLGGVVPPPRWLQESSPRVNFLAAESTDLSRFAQRWEDLVLTPEEDEVLKSLQLIEPRIERVAILSDNGRTSANILLKLKDSEARLPLGSLGGGVRHLLALVLNLLSAREGALLVDEIDTGLHYSVMVDMWRLLIESAKRLDTQVFVTTHSLDCVRALARFLKKYPETASEVIVHRVEKDADKTVVYEADEIVLAADGHIEVR